MFHPPPKQILSPSQIQRRIELEAKNREEAKKQLLLVQVLLARSHPIRR